jgi:hypothetical protein
VAKVLTLKSGVSRPTHQGSSTLILHWDRRDRLKSQANLEINDGESCRKRLLSRTYWYTLSIAVVEKPGHALGGWFPANLLKIRQRPAGVRENQWCGVLGLSEVKSVLANRQSGSADRPKAAAQQQTPSGR